jgi:hypothetical protein
MGEDFVSVCEECRRVGIHPRKGQLIVAAKLIESRRIGNTNVVRRGSLEPYIGDRRREHRRLQVT